MGTARIMGVVVTFDAPQHLARCISALQESERPVDRIVVVDNGQAEPLGNVDHVRMGYNSGPAGGFREGLHQFLASDFDYCWLMDDDIRPEASCLGTLLYESSANSVMYPLLRDQHGDIQAGGYGWTGLLVPRSAVEAAGLPRAELFWACEDSDWINERVARVHGFSLDRSATATVNATLRAPGPKPRWKLYYEARNKTWTCLYGRSEPLASRLRILAYRLAKQVRSTGPRGWPSIAHGVLDGMFGRLGIRVQPTVADRPA